MANENFDKVYEYIRENSIWDNIDMEIAEDHDGDTYIIVFSHKDIDKLHEVVKEVLELGDEKFYVDEVLEVEIVFNDEYTTCSDCGKIIRTSPTSYHWQPDYYLGDGFIVCKPCFIDNGYATDYIEDKINDPKVAISEGLIGEKQLKEEGFKRYNEDSYENGYHRGQTDDPEDIYDELKDKFEEIVFFIDSTGQFDTHFSAWVRG